MSDLEKLGYNDRMRAERLLRELDKQQAWASSVSAQAEIKRREANRELAAMGLGDEYIEYAGPGDLETAPVDVLLATAKP